jgi:hypothetical protein
LDVRLQELEEQERQLISRMMDQTRLQMRKWELDQMMLGLEHLRKRMSSGYIPAELDVISPIESERASFLMQFAHHILQYIQPFLLTGFGPHESFACSRLFASLK